MQSYDATTHFESTVEDVIAMYSRITGKVFLNWIMVIYIYGNLYLSSSRLEIHETGHSVGLDEVCNS